MDRLEETSKVLSRYLPLYSNYRGSQALVGYRAGTLGGDVVAGFKIKPNTLFTTWSNAVCHDP